jgi:mycothione reductase
MKEYDVVVIGSGAALYIVENAVSHGLSTALIDRGPLGGTCLNVGCIPSKMLIYPGDRVMDIRDSEKLGVTAEIKNIDFTAVMKRTAKIVSHGATHVREGIRHAEGLDFYEGQGHFIGERTLQINGEEIRGKKVVIASGARPEIPAIQGIETVDFLTNESLLHLKRRPESMIIIGGGYIAAEYAHFFSAMGSQVTILQRNKRIVPEEEPEISELLKRKFAARMKVFTDTEAVSMGKSGGNLEVTAREKGSGRERKFSGEKVLLAAGRTSNADLLRVEAAGVETDKRNFIKVDEYFETNKKNIWAFGDAMGKKMFRHVANKEASVVWRNAFHNARETVDYLAAPHAVFSWPEIASVGLTEEEAAQRYHIHDLLVGRANYSDVARGEAMMEEEGFCKAIVKKDGDKILGFHIIGPHASILIQEVVIAMANNLNIWAMNKGMHIHPALSEVVLATLANLEEAGPNTD